MNWRPVIQRYVIGELTWRRFVTSAALTYLLFFALAWLMSERMIFRPPPSSYQDGPEIMKLRTADGLAISAMYLPPASNAPVLLFSHGNAEDLGYARADIRELHRLGFGVLAYDYRGYGTSDGEPSESGSYRDIEAAYDFLRNTARIPAERIIAYGRSLGGGPSTELASNHPLRGLVLESAFVSAFRVVTRWPLFPIDRFRNLSKLDRIHCPVLVLHGTDDVVVPYWHGKALFDAAHEPKQLFTVKGASHLTVMDARDFSNVLRRWAGFEAPNSN